MADLDRLNAKDGSGDERSSHPEPIGVFDSGVGGLTILQDLLRELPSERYIYYGDTGNCPYGVRPQSEIIQLSLNAAAFLIERGAKIIVVACNTASSAAIHALRAAYPQIKFVAVVPAVKPAAALSRSGRVAIAATESAAGGEYLRGLIAQFAQGVEVYPVGCQRLVALAEQGELDGPEVEAQIRADLGPSLARGVDVVALGCTHFPAMRAAFERVCGPGVTVIDSGEAVARQTRRVLRHEGLLATPDAGPLSAPRLPTAGDEFWRSGADGAFDRIAATILGGSPVSQYAEGMLLASRATRAG
ncbi:MAG TPA: glutamate racemase [Ktedonobacterales bacterium]